MSEVLESGIELSLAVQLAGELSELLAPCASKIRIGGSVRRNRPIVKDIELVIESYAREDQCGLFEDVEAKPSGRSEMRRLCDELMQRDILRPRLFEGNQTRWGERTIYCYYKRVRVDLFGVMPPAQWGVKYLIATGPKEFNQRFVTPKLDGGCLPLGMKIEKGALWDRGKMIVTPEETDVFHAVGMAYVEPWERC